MGRLTKSDEQAPLPEALSQLSATSQNLARIITCRRFHIQLSNTDMVTACFDLSSSIADWEISENNVLPINENVLCD